MKKIAIKNVILCLVMFIFVACGSKKEVAKTIEGTEKIKLVISIDTFLDDNGIARALEEIKTMDKYSNIDFDIKPKEPDYLKKMPIMVASGEQLDIIGVGNPILKASYSEGLLQPLDKYVEETGIDLKKEFGRYEAEAMYDGKTMMIPMNVRSWVLYYNKDIFDKAGIEYPNSEVPMTWDDYRKLAKKLTVGEGESKIYGALHLTWPMFWYGEAIMKLGGGDKFYTKNGLSNIENPAFKSALESTYDMMYEDKSIPTYAELIVGKVNPDLWMNGKFGMIVSGAWVMQWATMSDVYPRDWKLGIAPMPVDSGTKRKTWGVVNGFAVPSSSKHPKEALEVAVEISRLAKKYAKNIQMANQTVESSELFEATSNDLEKDGITKEQIVDNFANPTTEFLVEKVTGRNPARYEQVIKEEVEKYFIQEQNITDTINRIKSRGDITIKK